MAFAFENGEAPKVIQYVNKLGIPKTSTVGSASDERALTLLESVMELGKISSVND